MYVPGDDKKACWRYCESEMHAQDGEHVSQAEKKMKNTFPSSNRQIYWATFWSFVQLWKMYNWTSNVSERFCWQPCKQLRICKTAVASFARFLKQPTYGFNIFYKIAWQCSFREGMLNSRQLVVTANVDFLTFFLLVLKKSFILLVLKASSL